jgi:Short C-terminal domain
VADERAARESAIEANAAQPTAMTAKGTKARPVAPIILTIGALLFTLGMLVGAFGPWVKVLAVSIGGTDGSNDGWFVVGAAIVALGFLLGYGLYRAGSRWLMLGPALAGVVAAAVTIYDRGNVSDKLARAGLIGEVGQIGWGLNLAMVASIVLAVISVVALIYVDHPNATLLSTERPTATTAGELERLSKLHESGSLTTEEFEAAKAQLLRT